MATFDQTVKTILDHLTFTNAAVDLNQADDAVYVTVTVDESDSGALIGYHGEKIDALQLILTLMYNQGKDDFVPVRLDVNQYRSRRTEALEQLADKASEQALESGREIILPPLSPAERRQVHLHLSQRADISTYSEGEGRARRLIVRPSKS